MRYSTLCKQYGTCTQSHVDISGKQSQYESGCLKGSHDSRSTGKILGERWFSCFVKSCYVVLSKVKSSCVRLYCVYVRR